MIDIDNCILFERIGSVQFNLNFDRILLYMMEGLNTGHSSSRIKLSNVNEELVRFGEKVNPEGPTDQLQDSQFVGQNRCEEH